MKISHGIDIVSVPRMQQTFKRSGAAFRRRVFTAAESAYCETKRMKYEHYAARFAAKEAAMKALTGLGHTVSNFRDIEVCRHATGKPYLHLAAATRKRLGLARSCQMELSMAHEREYAIATVVIVTGDR